ncbi:MAG TPA: 4Fe-4S binding protein [Acidobacteriota bacterium]|nr:4Fe-4S binding protein [Acidobacteriota bacterium]
MTKIIIDEEKCDGCGLCIPSCHEGALAIVDGKAKMVNESLCDGMGACIGECPRGAITLIEEKKSSCCSPARNAKPEFSCPSSKTLTFDKVEKRLGEAVDVPSELRQWPVQLHLVSPGAPYFKGADILIAADCTAFAVGDFHGKFLRDKSLVIACPKLDEGLDSYVEKLSAMFAGAAPKSVTVLMMEVPCCSKLLGLVKEAMSRSGAAIPLKAVVVSLRGETIFEEEVS